MSPSRILAIGELLWDVFPNGPRFGGAPANFACAVAALGAATVEVELASAVGRDDLGAQALELLARHGVRSTLTRVNAQPTGRVDVTIDPAGKASYLFATDSAWDHLGWDEELATAVRKAAVICFGTLGQRSGVSRHTIRRALREAPPGCLRILDINLRTPFWNEEVIRESLSLANVIKLNDEELPVVANILGLSGSEREMLEGLRMRYSPRLIALTRGANGSLLINAEGEANERAGLPVTIADTVGAGDSFTAVLAIGLARGLPLEVTHRRAAEVAAYVCTQPGGAPILPMELRMDGD